MVAGTRNKVINILPQITMRTNVGNKRVKTGEGGEKR